MSRLRPSVIGGARRNHGSYWSYKSHKSNKTNRAHGTNPRLAQGGFAEPNRAAKLSVITSTTTPPHVEGFLNNCEEYRNGPESWH
jgi:hypothetical protein